MKKISGEVLAAGGTYLFVAAFVFAVTVHISDTPDLPEDPFLLGQYYFNHDENPDGPYDLRLAREYYEEALRADTEHENPLLWYQLGRIDFIEGKFSAAISKFDKQIEYFGDALASVYYMLGLTYGFKAKAYGDEEDWQKAEESFSKYISLDSSTPWAKTDLAWVYFEQEKYAEMIELLDWGLSQDPEHPWMLNLYGLALMNTGNPEEAITYFEAAQAVVDTFGPMDWGMAYPGNDPALWPHGVAEFQLVIEKNIEIARNKIANSGN